MNGLNPQDLNQLKQIEEMKREVLSKILTKEAFERLARVRAVNPQLAAQVDVYLLQIYQTGKIQEQITDDKLKGVLKVLGTKKDYKIKRR